MIIASARHLKRSGLCSLALLYKTEKSHQDGVVQSKQKPFDASEIHSSSGNTKTPEEPLIRSHGGEADGGWGRLPTYVHGAVSRGHVQDPGSDAAAPEDCGLDSSFITSHRVTEEPNRACWKPTLKAG